MAVWGIGAYYNGSNPADKTELFIKKNCAYIGWKENEAPSIHAMFAAIKVGDMVYIKSFIPKTKQLHIKAIGIVSDNNRQDCADLGLGISVKWKKDFQSIKIDITDAIYKNNVFNNTLYEEYNPDIIKEIINQFYKCNSSVFCS